MSAYPTHMVTSIGTVVYELPAFRTITSIDSHSKKN